MKQIEPKLKQNSLQLLKKPCDDCRTIQEGNILLNSSAAGVDDDRKAKKHMSMTSD